jgi:hypothetical protein
MRRRVRYQWTEHPRRPKPADTQKLGLATALQAAEHSPLSWRSNSAIRFQLAKFWLVDAGPHNSPLGDYRGVILRDQTRDLVPGAIVRR